MRRAGANPPVGRPAKERPKRPQRHERIGLYCVIAAVVAVGVIFGIAALGVYDARLGWAAIVTVIALLLIFARLGASEQRAQQRKHREYIARYGEHVGIQCIRYRFALECDTPMHHDRLIAVTCALTGVPAPTGRRSWGALDEAEIVDRIWLGSGRVFKMASSDSCPQLLADGINRVIDAKGLPLRRLSAADITASDGEALKARRKDKQPTACHDINVAHGIIKRQGFELLSVDLLHDFMLTIMDWAEIDGLNRANGFDGTFLAAQGAKTLREVYDRLKEYDSDNRLTILGDGQAIELAMGGQGKIRVFGDDYIEFPNGGHGHPDGDLLQIYQELLDAMYYSENAVYDANLPPWNPPL
jgi:hypothetical protein